LGVVAEGKFREPRTDRRHRIAAALLLGATMAGVTEMPIPEGEQLSAVARDAARSGEVVYLTDRGRRLAAIVPAALAELLDRREGTPGRRVLGARAAGRSGRHDISERIEEIFGSEVTP
jgi:antitoxin (DNA-binding transcriptional repressor) of toxin-antitoxin stability system